MPKICLMPIKQTYLFKATCSYIYMDKQSVDLGFVLKQFPKFNFSMDDFDGRLRLQKFIYLLQTFDIYLGYDYSWYLRGPYCTNLAACGFELEKAYHRIPDGEKMKFRDGRIQKKFEKFIKFISGHEDDIDFLEIAASLHFQKQISELSDDEIIEKVANKRYKFTKESCIKIWEEMKRWNLI